MDKLVKYRQIIKQLINDYEILCNQPTTPTQVVDHAVLDEATDRYILYRTGWWERKRVNSATLYLRLYIRHYTD